MNEKALESLVFLHSNFDFRSKLNEISHTSEAWGILIFGIDGFKRINNLYSYTFGDKVLSEFALKISMFLDEYTFLYRLDGDCFGILSKNATKEMICEFFNIFKNIAEQKICVDGTDISFTLSGGACTYPCFESSDGESLYKNARIAMIDSKDNGGNRLTFLSEEILKNIHHSMKLIEDIRYCVHNNFEGFFLNYQSIIDAQSGNLYGCEVLLRWEHNNYPQGVSPYYFIPILENYGMISEMGKWVIDNGLKQLAEWSKVMPNFQMSINVSSIEFEDTYFKFYVIDKLRQYNIDPKLLTLELTESGKISEVELVSKTFDFLRSQGIKIAFDDFGTGYASLEIFRVLSADELKIDRSFLERISYDVTDQKIISQLIKLCDSINMFVCVEGIETKEIELIAKQLNPKLLQGYYYSEPISAQQFFELYLANKEFLPTSSLSETDNKEKSMSYSAFKPAKPMSLEEIVDNAHAGIFQVGMDSGFTFLTCNEGYRRMLGYTAKEMNEKFKNRALGFVHPDDMERVNEEIREQLGQGDTVLIEFRVIKSDGTPIWILGSGNVVKGKNGSSSLIVVIIENNKNKINHLKEKAENEFHKKVLTRIPTGIKYIHNDEFFTIDYFSDSFLSITGFTREEIETKFENRYINLVYEPDREKATADLQEQIKFSNVVVLHYRMICKGDKLKWVETVACLYPPDEDGIQRWCSNVVSVIDKFSDAQKDRVYSLNTNFHHKMHNWDNVLFELDIHTKSIRFSENYFLIFGRFPTENFENEFLFIHEEDKPKLIKTLYEATNYNNIEPVEIRVLHEDKYYIWCNFTFISENNNVRTSIIGKIKNIDEEVKNRIASKVNLSKDKLTGLLNKTTIETKAASLLKDKSKNYALFIIDIDDFKNITAKLGYTLSDEIIKTISKLLKNTFNKQALIARTGGDEFMVFWEFNKDNPSMESFANKLLKNINEHAFNLNENKIHVSVSIGISVWEDKNTMFYDIYSKAYSALFRAKELGKCCYSIF